MQEKYYLKVKDLLLKVFRVRKYLIRCNTDKKAVTLTEIEILEQELLLINSPAPAAKFILKHFDKLLYYIQPNQKIFIETLNKLAMEAKEILKE